MNLDNAIALLNIYNIECNSIEGYQQLSDYNRSTFERFLLDFLDKGTVPRDRMIPLSIHWIEDVEYLAYGIDYEVSAGNRVYAIDRYGSRELIEDWIYEEYESQELDPQEADEYLRFEYKTLNSEGEEEIDWIRIDDWI